jgi:hypothetical protein
VQVVVCTLVVAQEEHLQVEQDCCRSHSVR